MRTRERGLFGACLLVAGLSGTALGGTCTIHSGGATLIAHVPSAGDFEFSSVDERVLDVDIDPTTGKFTVHRIGIAPIDVGTQGGPVKLDFSGPDAVGTIDAAGNVSLPAVSYDELFGTAHLPANPTLGTGPHSEQLNGKEFGGHGTPLDFTTGILSLEGAQLLPNAPIVSESVISGLRIECQLAPIPAPATLPKAATLKAVGGNAKSGRSGPPDTLKLKATLVASGIPANLATGDLFISIHASGGPDLVSLFVRAGDLHGKGRHLTVTDSDGSLLHVLAGRTGDADAPGPTSGTLHATTGKKVQLNLRVTGLDLTPVTGTLVLSVTAGPAAASTKLTVSGTGRTRRLH
jgi:hypothetical protein